MHPSPIQCTYKHGSLVFKHTHTKKSKGVDAVMHHRTSLTTLWREGRWSAGEFKSRRILNFRRVQSPTHDTLDDEQAWPSF
jgi:hypothetical protein